MKRIRLAVVTDAIAPWYKGGKEMRYGEILSRLPDEGFDITVYTMKWWLSAPPLEENAKGSLRYKAICPKFELYRKGRRSIVQALVFALSTLRLLFVGMDAIEADQMPYLQLVPLKLVAVVRRVPLVVTWHEVWGAGYWKKYLGRFGVIAAAIEKLCTKLPTRVVAVSEAVRNDLIELGMTPEKVVVAQNAVDAAMMTNVEMNPEGSALLFVGRLLSHKRCDLAVMALREVRDKGYNVRLGVIGRGPEWSNLVEQADALGISDFVTFHGTFDTQDEVWSYMKAAKVLVFPSEREGFGLTVAEALLSGTPAVVVDADDNASRKLVAPGVSGSVVPPGDVLAIAQEIAHWLDKDTDRGAISRQVLVEHPEMSWGSTVTCYSQLLREVVR